MTATCTCTNRFTRETLAVAWSRMHVNVVSKAMSSAIALRAHALGSGPLV